MNFQLCIIIPEREKRTLGIEDIDALGIKPEAMNRLYRNVSMANVFEGMMPVYVYDKLAKAAYDRKNLFAHRSNEIINVGDMWKPFMSLSAPSTADNIVVKEVFNRLAFLEWWEETGFPTTEKEVLSSKTPEKNDNVRLVFTANMLSAIKILEPLILAERKEEDFPLDGDEVDDLCDLIKILINDVRVDTLSEVKNDR